MDERFEKLIELSMAYDKSLSLLMVELPSPMTATRPEYQLGHINIGAVSGRASKLSRAKGHIENALATLAQMSALERSIAVEPDAA